MFASMRFLIFLFCFLTFLFFTCPSFLFFFSLSSSVDNNDAYTGKLFFFFCRHKSVIDCSSSVCMCVYCSGSNCELFSICPYSKRARERAHSFVVNWVFTFEDGRVCVKERKRLKTIDESTLYWCLSLVRLHSSSLKSCLLRWSYLK